MSLLTVDGITAGYGARQALFGVDLMVDEGEVVALMGRSGMGKSTTANVISRLLPHSQGQVRFAGQDLASVTAYKAAALGLGLVPEGGRIFPNLTVQENLRVSARRGEWTADRVHHLFPRLAERGRHKAGTLSAADQQMLAMGRALMTNPRLLILDEVTEGLPAPARQEIWTAIATLKMTTGLAILVVDGALDELRNVADAGVILERGVSVWHGTLDMLGDDTKARFLGG